MEIFKATVQYNDLIGSAAADNADMQNSAKWLEQNGYISADEYVIGISLWSGEHHGTYRDPVSVKFLVSGLNGYENIPEMIQASGGSVQVKEINLDMNITDFLALFKRFAFTLSNSGLIEGKSYSTDN